MKLISWNLRHRQSLWSDVANLDADIALLQEACEPPAEIRPHINVDHEPWSTEGRKPGWRTSVVGLNPDLFIDRFTPRRLGDAGPEHIGVSRLGTLTAARVAASKGAKPITMASFYAAWERPHISVGKRPIFADASAHRLISDISTLVCTKGARRIVIAGDFNCLYGYGEGGDVYWAARYQTVFDRFAAIGLKFVGPQSPGGRQAEPWPLELPIRSTNVPTYYSSHQKPTTAARQLDFVFASIDMVERISVRALNQVEDWGPSDHCRVEITIRDP